MQRVKNKSGIYTLSKQEAIDKVKELKQRTILPLIMCNKDCFYPVAEYYLGRWHLYIIISCKPLYDGFEDISIVCCTNFMTDNPVNFQRLKYVIDVPVQQLAQIVAEQVFYIADKIDYPFNIKFVCENNFTGLLMSPYDSELGVAIHN